MVISNLHKTFIKENLSNYKQEFQDLNILVVNKFPIDRLLIVNTLVKVGITHVKDAVAGVEAFSTLLEGDFNLLITDWDIPNMNGIELTRAIRTNDKLKNLPIFIITTRSMIQDVIKAKKTGVNEYIIKPFEAETLIYKIVKINRIMRINI